jgi:arginyl-tRNA synthetase
MKQLLQNLLQQAISNLKEQAILPTDLNVEIQLEKTRDPKFGDFACNLAMQLAKPLKQKPRDIAELILKHLPISDKVTKTEIAGAGFINFFLASNAFLQVIDEVLDKGEQFGKQPSKNQTIQVEFVSANPTGPLHVGHGRGAAYGAALGNLLETAGYNVHREYYVNDAGRQMNILAASVWLRYLELCGETFAFPSNGYKGDYIFDIAATLHRENGLSYHFPILTVFENIPADAPEGDKELHIDALIEKAQMLLGSEKYEIVFQAGLQAILEDIRKDLEQFGVTYNEWFSERSLNAQQAIDKLKESGFTYLQEGALWFRSTAFGDEKDRVLVRDNGQATYFASDVAYHLNKLSRGFGHLINIWGADHHGYIPRVKAAMQALGANPEQLTVLLVQFATLYRGKEKVQMSTRSGEFVTLRELREEVGNDATRFFYVLRKSEQHIDFDLELAKSQSNDNPVFYIQYAHARICSVFRQLEEKGFKWESNQANLSLLIDKHEQDLLVTMLRYPELINVAAQNYEPHQIAYYLKDLATEFHTYYNACQFIVDEITLRNARLTLIKAVQQVLQNGLKILGVSAPETM